jgi:hypothetical protein
MDYSELVEKIMEVKDMERLGANAYLGAFFYNTSDPKIREAFFSLIENVKDAK